MLFACGGRSANELVPPPGPGAAGFILHARADFLLQGTNPPLTIPSSVDVGLYFPQGRVSGAPYLLAHESVYPRDGVTTVSGALDGSLGASGISLSATNGQSTLIEGQLNGDTSCVHAHVTRNLAYYGTDVAEFGEADMDLCPVGDAPAPTFRTIHALVPNSVVWLEPSAPVRADAIHVVVRSGDRTIPVSSVEARDGAVRVVPGEPLSPNQPVTVDVSGTTDVLGRPFTFDGDSPVLHTTAEITDFTFSTQPPQGSVVAATSIPMVSNGTLTIRAFPLYGPGILTMFALGNPAARSTLTIRASVRCSQGGTSFSAIVVSERGASVSVPLVCGNDQSISVAPPPSGALWLTTASDLPNGLPQVAYAGVSDEFTLDEIAFR